MMNMTHREEAMIDRPLYLDWLGRWRDKDVIKVIVGMRRCGKSTVLKLFSEKLVTQGVDLDSIISINFEKLDEAYPTTPEELYRYIAERLRPGKNYVFLDEVQHVRDFERVVDGLFVRDDVDLYITGSNAFFLSGELATLLTGRYVELRVLPLSFAEYHSANPDESPDAAFNRYLAHGGLPYTLEIERPNDIADYLGGVFNTIIVKDIAARNPRMDMGAFSNVAAFLADNVGNLTSLQKISRGLAAHGRKASTSTVGTYVEALRSSYLLYEARRYDIHGKQHLDTLGKYYLGDLGLRFWLLGRDQGDVGHRVENVVYLELLNRYRNVSVGTMRNGEIDFVAVDARGPRYYQVALTVLDSATLERELAPLRAVKDNYPKTLLTLDRIGASDHGGIEQKNLVDWLLEPTGGR